MKAIIIGGSETGLALANKLSEIASVTIFEADKDLAQAIAQRVDSLIINTDPTDVNALEEAGIEGTSIFIAATNDDKTNLVCCQIAQNKKVETIISLLNSPKNQELFKNSNLTYVISVVDTNVDATLAFINSIKK